MSVYVVNGSNLRKNMYKIGFTTTALPDLKRRYNTYYSNLQVHYFERYEDHRAAEKEIHQRLDKYRIDPKHEHFNCSLFIIKYELSIMDGSFDKYNPIQKFFINFRYNLCGCC